MNDKAMNNIETTKDTNRLKRRRLGERYNELYECVQLNVELNNKKVKDNLNEKIMSLAKIGNSEGVIKIKEVDSILGEYDCYDMNNVVAMIKKEEGFYVTVLYDWMFEENVQDFIYFDILQKV